MTIALGRSLVARHVMVGASIAGTTGLAMFGVIGNGDHPERFDAKTVVVQALDEQQLRIVEYVDQDFGDSDRHGYERIVDNSFGAPVDVEASSPDAPDDLSVVDQGDTTRIRIGDPDTTISGQHRYTLAYTYPEARLDELGLALSIVAPRGGSFPGDQETERFEVIVTGMQLENMRCDTGPGGATGGCTLERVPGSEPPEYRAVLEPLPEDAGLSIYADVVSLSGSAKVTPPAIVERRSSNRAPLVIGMPIAGLAAAVPMFLRARRKGRNEVYAGGAADAAYGSLPSPGAASGSPPSAPVLLVADDEMDELATTDFAPPKGIAPWQARVLLTEQVDDATVAAWFSGLAGREAITLENNDNKLVIASGPRRAELVGDDAVLLDRVLAEGDPYVTGKYDSGFAAAWQAIRRHQLETIRSSGWWTNMPPGSAARGGCLGPVIVILVFGFVIGGAGVGAALGLLHSWPAALVFGIVVPAIAASLAYAALLPARSAQGSALALRTESFRRFLDASEGRHVEWAWEHGLLREYSGWAVALDEADAWSRAMQGANVPAPAQAMAAPILIHSMGSSIHSSRTAPSSSGSSGGGGGGGFSGGSGGGGGGGSSGSW